MTSTTDRVAMTNDPWARVEAAYRHHSHQARALWRMPSMGPRLDVMALGEDGMQFTLQGRTRTLARMRYVWEWRGTKPWAWKPWAWNPSHRGNEPVGIEEALLPQGPLDQLLQDIATVQAMRSAVARHTGVSNRAMSLDKIVIDRTAAMEVAAANEGILGQMAEEARRCDRMEIVPISQTPYFCNKNGIPFTIAPCEYDMATRAVRQCEIRIGSIEIGDGAYYLNNQLTLHSRDLPETARIAAIGRRLDEVIKLGKPHFDDRIIEEIHGEVNLNIKLKPDQVELGTLKMP